METANGGVGLKRVWWISSLSLVTAFGAGCSSGSGTGGGNLPLELGPICGVCAGGQTSDFGGKIDGCSIGEGTPLDVSAASALGFETEGLEREFELPLTWAPRPTSNGGPATGYEPETTIHGRTTLVSLEHVQPSHSTCTDFANRDFVRVTLNLELASGDKALAVAGEVNSIVRRNEVAHVVSGLLGLEHATGSLRLFPDSWSWVNYGDVSVIMYFRPEQTRGALSVALLENKPVPGSDTGPTGRQYSPLDARFPKDACDLDRVPLAPGAPGASPTGLSAVAVRDELQALIGTAPVAGSWSSGETASVTTTLGAPSSVCVNEHGLRFQLPWTLASDDGRIQTNGLASSSVGYSAGQIAGAWIGYYDREAVSKASFPAHSGVTGVEFGDVQAASWQVQLRLLPTVDLTQDGELSVEGVDIDGSRTGVQGAVLPPLAKFHWSK